MNTYCIKTTAPGIITFIIHLKRQRFLAEIFNRNFILLWLGNSVSAIGNELNIIAFSVFVLKRYDSVSLMSITMALSFLPRALGGLIAGSVADYFNPKKIMVLCDLIRGVLLVGMAIASFSFELPLGIIFLIVFLNGIADAFFDAGVSVVLPQVVPNEKLTKVYSLYSAIVIQIIFLGFKPLQKRLPIS